MLVDLPCTSKLNVESRVIKPLAVGLLDWKLLSPARVTLLLYSYIPNKRIRSQVLRSWSLLLRYCPSLLKSLEVSFQNISPFSKGIKPNLFETLSNVSESNAHTQRCAQAV